MKNQKLTTILVTLIFTAVLAFAWVYFAGFYSEMAVVGALILTFAHALSFAGVIALFEDPDYDWLRRVAILTAVAAAIVLLASGSQNKVDQEQRAQSEQIVSTK